MKFSFIHNLSDLTTTDLLVVPMGEGERFGADVQTVDHLFDGLIEKHIRRYEFKRKKQTTLLIQTQQGIAHVLLVGMGDKKPSVYEMLALGAHGAKKAKEVHAESVAFVIPEEYALEHVATGFMLSNYEFRKYKNVSKDKQLNVQRVTFITSNIKVEGILEKVRIVSSAVTFARDLVNISPSETTPLYLVDVARSLVTNDEQLLCKVLSPEEMSGMGGLLGIARGSSQPPQFIHLTYNGGRKNVITLVGKGITFDSGGLSIKTSEGMQTMKLDMSGAALILAVFSVLSKLHPNITVHGLIPATENMLGPNAVKPGDVVTGLNGKTIEILNTDAEGRVILADAMSYAEKHIKSDAIIDFATLTGACMVALGEDVAGLFCNDKKLRDALMTIAANTGEKVWELPLVEEYKEKLKSHIADIKNIGGKYGGAITGALFIEAFVPKNTPWAHIDIAGPSFTEKDTILCRHGGTGFGVRMALDYLLSL